MAVSTDGKQPSSPDLGGLAEYDGSRREVMSPKSRFTTGITYRRVAWRDTRKAGIYSFGAKLIPREGEERIFLWNQKVRHGRVSYEINRNHPLVRQSLATCRDKGRLHALLRLVEETIPVPLITITDREKPDQTLGPFEATNAPQIIAVMKEAFNALRATGYSAKEALTRLRTMEPFPRFPAELEAFAEKEERDEMSELKLKLPRRTGHRCDPAAAKT